MEEYNSINEGFKYLSMILGSVVLPVAGMILADCIIERYFPDKKEPSIKRATREPTLMDLAIYLEDKVRSLKNKEKRETKPSELEKK